MPAVTLWTYYLSGFWGIPNDHCNCFKDHLYIHSGVSFDKWNIIETLQLKIWIQSCYLRWWSGIDFSTTYLSLRLDSFCQYICCRVTLLCVLGLSPGSRPGHARGSTQGMGVFWVNQKSSPIRPEENQSKYFGAWGPLCDKQGPRPSPDVCWYQKRVPNSREPTEP